MSAILNAHPNCCQPYYAYVEGDAAVVNIKFSSLINAGYYPGDDQFTVTLSGGNPTATGVFIPSDFTTDGEQMWLVILRNITAGETGTVSYSKTGSGYAMVDWQGNEIDAFTLPITNLIT